MCNFLNFSHGCQLEKRHKMANKANDHAVIWPTRLGLGLTHVCVFNNSNKLYLSVLCFSD